MLYGEIECVLGKLKNNFNYFLSPAVYFLQVYIVDKGQAKVSCIT